ncbi:hypothetical protein ISN45_Aa07g004690 [Arabidopsis thaliana x Arabidopsis arenosa]|uniref:KIB1-4 beta-propeller domain-containing protein n=1 Tax=Arabidopsis thaliana x Arabidopsis arenosa TaxID=1240361 RepID=A0A8T1Y1E8_9BRAS|nr:hypothetical protein ISN45_Aa07g004690 [Arabidopsis thaliana x Arabidopsis arenosa]
MSEMIVWSDLPGDLLDHIANGLFSKVELLRFRSICKTCRSAVATNKSFLDHLKRNRRRLLSPYSTGKTCSLSPAAFYRVVLSSYPDKGWLIKIQDVYVSSQKQLLSPLSRFSIKSSGQTLDLLDFTVTEMHQSYDVEYLYNSTRTSFNFARVVLLEDLVFVVDYYKKIWWCNSNESDNQWARVMDEEVKLFSDIVFHKGYMYALDLKGAVWWISLSEFEIFQYGPSTPLDYYDIDTCKDKRFVEYCGDLCIVHRFCRKFRLKRVDIDITVGFKVYKMDEELVEYVEVKSLGDKAFVMATDSCFTVLAREYYGCLENSIYFTDEEERNNVKVFKLGDGSITKMVDSSFQSCFQMLIPPLV